MTEPAVSVIVACYNHARFVEECLAAIDRQTFRDFELVVVDDASSDISARLIRAWIQAHSPGATFIAHEQNVGVCRSLNEAIITARGRYLALVSGDDVWLPHKLATQVAQLEAAAPEVGAVYSDAELIDDTGTPLNATFLGRREIEVAPEGDIFEVMLRSNFIPAPGALFRASSFHDIGLLDEQLRYEDWDFWVRFTNRYQVAFTPIPVAQYRAVSTSLGNALRTDGHVANYLIMRKALGLRPSTDEFVKERLLFLAQHLTQGVDDAADGCGRGVGGGTATTPPRS